MKRRVVELEGEEEEGGDSGGGAEGARVLGMSRCGFRVRSRTCVLAK